MTRPAGLPWGNGLDAVAAALRERADAAESKPTLRMLTEDARDLALALDQLRADVDSLQAAAEKWRRGLTLKDTCDRIGSGAKVEWA